GVHSSYEDVMVDFAAKEIAQKLSNFNFDPLMEIKTGKDAATATIAVMSKAAEKLHPAEICKEFDKFKKAHHFTGTGKLKSSGPYLANLFTDQTVSCMALGIHLLASLWKNAFSLAADTSKFHVVVSDDDLMKLYKQQEFLPSYYLG